MGVFKALLRELAAIFARAHAHDRETLDQGHIDRDSGDAVGGKTDNQQAAIKADAAHAFVKHIAADRVINDIGPSPAGNRLDLLTKASCHIQHGIGGIVRHHYGQFFIRGRGGNHPRAHLLGQINSR